MESKEVLNYTINQLMDYKIRHEIHRFDSGCVMIDIWIRNELYSLQFEENKVGCSLVTRDTDFSTIPDKWYKNFEEFKIQLEGILQNS